MSVNPLLPHLVTVTRNLENLMALIGKEGVHYHDDEARCPICRFFAQTNRAIQDAKAAIARMTP